MIATIQLTMWECIGLGLVIWLAGVFGSAFVFLIAGALRDRRRNEWKERCDREAAVWQSPSTFDSQTIN